jgi:hypothetical protein
MFNILLGLERFRGNVAGHGGGDLGQAPEHMSDADPLAGSAQIRAAFEVQPVRAGG